MLMTWSVENTKENNQNIYDVLKFLKSKDKKVQDKVDVWKFLNWSNGQSQYFLPSSNSHKNHISVICH